MGPRYPRFDRSEIRTYPLGERENLMGVGDLLPLNVPVEPVDDPAMERIAERMHNARARGDAIVWLIGAHVVKRGLSRFIIDLMERGWISHLAGNGAVSIHDFELALIGESAEDVGRYLSDGLFGMAEETGRKMNEALRRGMQDGLGYGESIGRVIEEEAFPHRDVSILGAGWRLGVPVTIHVSIGLDIIHQHPACDGAALGYTSDQDFLIFTHSVTRMGSEGVFLNLGSQVTGPEVFLKALSMARNRGYGLERVATANFDLRMIDLGPDEGPEKYERPDYYYRPKKNIVLRPNLLGGEGFHVVGEHRRTIPDLCRRLVVSRARR